MKEMAHTANVGEGVQKARARALIVPREHGAWGLLLVPLFTGVATGLPSAQRVWPLVLFVLAALVLFWLRTPVESLLGSGPMLARTPEERRVTLIAAILLATTSAACLIGLMWDGRNLKLLFIGAIAAFAFTVQTLLRRLGRGVRMAAQLVGAIGLTATAPAAYYVATGRLETHGLVLWAANWLFAANQIHFVQMNIHGFRGRTFREKLAQGRSFLLAETLLLVVLLVPLLWHWIPSLVVFAFAPALYRGTKWFFQGPEALDVKKLGWSEMRQGVAFGVLLAIALLVY
jgi:YwiC-like protein